MHGLDIRTTALTLQIDETPALDDVGRKGLDGDEEGRGVTPLLDLVGVDEREGGLRGNAAASGSSE